MLQLLTDQQAASLACAFTSCHRALLILTCLMQLLP
jgi:hypothetical protein